MVFGIVTLILNFKVSSYPKIRSPVPPWPQGPKAQKLQYKVVSSVFYIGPVDIKWQKMLPNLFLHSQQARQKEEKYPYTRACWQVVDLGIVEQNSKGTA